MNNLRTKTIATPAPGAGAAARIPGLRPAADLTATAEGLEQALAALGVLDEALTLDLRRPQDYFHRTWSTAFRARDLAALQAPDDATGQP